MFLVFLFVFLFVIAPYDVQIWIIGILINIPPPFWLGVLGATFAGSFWYSLGWNALAAQIAREEHEQADARMQARRR